MQKSLRLECVDDQVVPAIDESDEKPRQLHVFIPGLRTLGKDRLTTRYAVL
jgi:hypothetical protein